MSTYPPDLDATTEELNTLIRTITDEHARQVVTYFRETDETVVAFDDLVEYAAGNAGLPYDRDRIAIRLHHASLPNLAAGGVVEYDPGSQTVDFLDHSALDDVVALVDEMRALE